jgi:L-seryl-tRNA(Ser) seleniumtransferase
VDRLMKQSAVQQLMQLAPRGAVLAAVRESLEAARTRRAGPPEDWDEDIRERLVRRTGPELRPVLNATGVVLHTNLGRAPLAAAASQAMMAVASGYSNLELDLSSGSRGSRSDHCRSLLRRVTGAEDALVVNNAAGALLLALNATAEGRQVLISRGELIEIGGSFRIPDIMAKSGARLLEVGTTNRTHIQDYEGGLDNTVAAILTVHRSNFEQRGFVTSPEPQKLAELAARARIPYLYDIGSGLIADLSRWGLVGEPRVADALTAGATLVLFSGDKLLGGPQAGCIVGMRELVARCRGNPIARAVRADKLTLAALAATLSLYQDEEGGDEVDPGACHADAERPGADRARPAPCLALSAPGDGKPAARRVRRWRWRLSRSGAAYHAGCPRRRDTWARWPGPATASGPAIYHRQGG